MQRVTGELLHHGTTWDSKCILVLGIFILDICVQVLYMNIDARPTLYFFNAKVGLG